MTKLLKEGINKDIKKDNLNGYSVNEIEDMAKNLVEEFLPRQLEENCTVKYFRKMFIVLGLRKEFLSYAKSLIGIDEKNLCIFFIQNRALELLSNINQCAKIFKKEEEDRTNVKHIRQRKKMSYVDKLREISYITWFSLKKSSDGLSHTYTERILRSIIN